MYILGISAFYHDSAACLIRDGEIVAAAQEERFSKKKNDDAFPVNAIRFCVEKAEIDVSQIESIAFYDKPFLKFERLIESYLYYAPKTLVSFVKSMPVWIGQKLFLENIIIKELKKIGSFNKNKLNIIYPEHHLSHAASAYYSSGLSEAVILTIDGVGEWATASICKGNGKDITVLKELHYPHSCGLLYSAFTYFLGFEVNSGEYKLMGLAPYGNDRSDQFQEFVNLIETHLCTIYDDGSIFLNQRYFKYTKGLRMIYGKRWKNLFGVERREPDEPIQQYHCNLALAIQRVTETIILKMAMHAKEVTQSENLCLAGGVALNGVANGKLEQLSIFTKIYIQPAAGDAGGAIGAALAGYHIFHNRDLTQKSVSDHDKMKGAYLGPSYSDQYVENILSSGGYQFKQFKDSREKCDYVAGLLNKGKVVGWMQGRMEFGPRALGNRSILADPRINNMKKHINIKIKHRESFRPFAPAVVQEDVNDYFECDFESPYMQKIVNVKKTLNKPDAFDSLSLAERFEVALSEIPAVTHVDYSARVQTVSKNTNPEFWSLLRAFKKLSGMGILLNTSFNDRGQPIVCSPEDAIECFASTDLDFLVINSYVLDKRNYIK